MSWESNGRTSPSCGSEQWVWSEHSWLLGTVLWVSGASPVSLGGSLLYGRSLSPALSICPFGEGKGSPTWLLPPFLGSSESQGPSGWISPSGKSHWYVECSLEQFCPGKIRVQGQMRCQWSRTRPVVGGWVVGGGWTCLQGGLGLWKAWNHSTLGDWEGVGACPGESEHRCRGRSPWSTQGQCPRMHRWPPATQGVVVGSLASACLAAPAVSALHLAWGDGVTVAHHCSLLIGLTPFCGPGARTVRTVRVTQSWLVLGR